MAGIVFSLFIATQNAAIAYLFGLRPPSNRFLRIESQLRRNFSGDPLLSSSQNQDY